MLIPLRYEGAEDVTEWLQANNPSDPVLYPYWPDDEEAVVLSLDWDDANDPPWTVHQAEDLSSALEARRVDRLWFCEVPRRLVDEAFSADR